MFDPSTFKFKKMPKEVWDSSEDAVKCNDSRALSKTVCDQNDLIGSKNECNRLFNCVDVKKKINAHNNLPLFGDRDNDKILNVFDDNPRKKDEIRKIRQFLG